MNNTIITLDNTIKLLEESEVADYRAELIASAEFSNSNLFKTKPKGVIISDSYNNIAFPILEPEIDNGRKINLPIITKTYIAKYAKMNRNNILPWHYVVEFYQRDYVIFNTRPINMIYPFDSKIIRDLDNPLLNDETKKFIDNKSKDVSQYIHVLIIGNSELDIYIKSLYLKIGKMIISPMKKLHKFSISLGQGIVLLNMGKKFKAKVLANYAR